jgi:hypothetical protein
LSATEPGILHPRRSHVRKIQLLLLALSSASISGCLADILAPEASLAAANRAVDSWIKEHADEWRLTKQVARPPALADWSRPCSQNPPSGLTAIRIRESGMDVLLFFRCPVEGGVDAPDLNAAFSHAVLDELPHGITARGWRFTISTPSSSFSEAVMFSNPTAGRVRVEIDTPLYAVYGHRTRPSCQPPADAPSPPGCHLLREHRVPIRLTFSIPFGNDISNGLL